MARRGERIGEAYVRIHADGSGFDDEVRDELDEADPAFRKKGRDHSKEYDSGFAEGLESLRKRIRAFADLSGRMFGRGSRNDFANVIGSMVRGIARLPLLVPAAFRGLQAMAGALSNVALQGYQAAIRLGAAPGGMVASIAGLGRIALTGVAGLAAIGVAVAALTVLIGPLVAAFSMLLGAITAIASTLVLGVVAGVGAAAAVMLPFAAAIGVATAAFAGLDDAQQKALARDFRPLINDFKELGAVAREGLFSDLDRQMRDMRPVIQDLRPLVRGVADAMSNAATSFVQGLNSREFQVFRDEMTRFLPPAIESLGRSIENSLGGMGGILRGMIPFMQRTLRWLEGLTARFSEWANSRQGQRDIREFFEKVADSAKSIGDFLGSAWDFFAQIIGAGAGAGANIFDSMAGGLDRATQWLRENPDALQQWFADAQRFADILGDVLQGILAVVDALDTPLNRVLAGGALMGIAAGFQGISSAINLSPLGLLANALNDSGAAAEEAGPKITDFTGTLDQMTGAATRATRELAYMELQKAGVADAAARLDLSMRDVVSAAMGEKGAIDRVIASTRGLKTEQDRADARNLLTQLGLVGKGLDENQRALRDQITAVTTWSDALDGIGGKRLRVAVETLGIDMTLEELRALNEQFDLTPRQVRTIVRATGAKLSRRDVGDLIENLETLDGIEAVPNAKLDKTNLSREQKAAMRELNALGLQRPKPIASLDDKELERTRAAIDRRLTALGGRVETPTVDLQDNASEPISSIDRLLGGIDNFVTITIDVIGNAFSKVAGLVGDLSGIRNVNLAGKAAGGITSGPQLSLIGEAGPEAVVPLNRPLSMVDPAVRWLSAIAQGKVPGMASGGVVGRTLNVEQHIYSPSANPRAVAIEAVNHLAAVGY